MTPEAEAKVRSFVDKYTTFMAWCVQLLKGIGFPLDEDSIQEPAPQETLSEMRNMYLYARVEGASETEALSFVASLMAAMWKDGFPEWEASQRATLARKRKELARSKEQAAVMRNTNGRLGGDDAHIVRMESLIVEMEAALSKAEAQFEVQLKVAREKASGGGT